MEFSHKIPEKAALKNLNVIYKNGLFLHLALHYAFHSNENNHYNLFFPTFNKTSSSIIN